MNQNRILIVEDESITALDLERLLKAAGHEVMGRVATAESALEIAASQRPDLVLMDINLVGPMDGVEAAARLRDQDIPVVFLTAYCDNDTLQRAKLTEPFGYLAKPVDTRALEIALEIAFLRYRLWHQLKLSEALTQAILEHAHEGILTFDRLGTILDVNTTSLQIFGCTRDEALGEQVVDFIFPPSERDKYREEMNAAQKPDADLVFVSERETILQRTGGRKFPAELTLTRLAVDGTPRFTAFVRDITLRHRAQQEQDELVHDLAEDLARAQHLSRPLPICSWCKKIRYETNYWQEVSAYLQENAGLTFIQSICPDCNRQILAQHPPLGRPSA